MAQVIAISTIQERVRQLCDLPAFTTDTPITSAAILDFAKLACTLLAGVVRERSSELLLGGSTQLTTSTGISLVSLSPIEAEDIIRISWLKSPSEEIPLRIADSDRMQAYPAAWSGAEILYRPQGQAIELFPTPDDVYTLNFYYQGGIYITAAADTLTLRDAWDQWIALQMCILVRTRQQKDSSDFAAMLGMVDQTVRTGLRRDRFAVRQIRDQRATYDRLRTPHGRWF